MKRLLFTLLALAGHLIFAADSPGLRIVAGEPAIFTQPPRGVPTSGMVDGPLLGNGDVNVVLAGPPEAQKFYIGKNDFWRQGGDASPEVVGSLTFLIPSLQGASYHLEQDMANAEVRGTFTGGATMVTTRSWVDANENLLVTELQNGGSESVDISLAQQAGEGGQAVPLAVMDNDHTIAIGRELLDGGRFYFNGSIAGVTVLSRMLSPGEIKVLAGEQPPSSAKIFDGKSIYEERPPMKIGAAVSVSAWVRIESEGIANYVVSKGEWNQAYSLGLSGGHLRWSINGTFVQTDQTLELHKWIHIAGTFDGRRMAAYVDGKLQKKLDNGGATGQIPATAWFTRTADGTPESRRVAVVSHVLGAATRLWDDHLTVTLRPGEKVLVASSVLSDLDAKDCLGAAQASVANLSPVDLASLSAKHRGWWSDFWSRSFVEIPDKEIEKRWYAALYIMGSCSRAGKVAPGLWGWTTTDHTLWNGQYFMNYNFEAAYYMVYSANHADLSLPFYKALTDAIPNGRAMAARHGWKGIHLTVWLGPWGIFAGGDLDQQQRSDAAFAALNFIWEYQYTQDAEFLRNTAYPYLLEVAAFWEDYLKFENGRYVIYNDAVQENSGPDFNPLLSLALVHTLFENMISMSEVLSVDADRRAKWQDICDKISAFPVQERDGKTVFRYSEKGTAWWDNNTLGIHQIFPAGAIGLDSNPKTLEICRNTIDEMHRWTDENGFSSWYTACARVGYDPKIILSKLREQCDQHSLPNLILSFGGGGLESCGGFDCIDEMLLQSHEGVIRFFPDWPKDEDARFGSLRAVGAFLVSAEYKNGVIGGIKIVSEKGRDCAIVNPWPGKSVRVIHSGMARELLIGSRLMVKTKAGDTIGIQPEM